MAKTYTGIDGELRLYDGTGTPYYIAVIFEGMDLSAPLGRPRTEETMIFDRGRGDTNAHYISGPDDPIVEPMELSFSVRMQADATLHAKLIDALAVDQPASWTVDGDTWVTTKGDFSLVNGDGSTFTDPAFDDSRKYCVNVEALWTAGGVAEGYKWGAVYFPADQQTVAEAEDSLIINCTGQIYGLVTSIQAFTSGNES